ncbi:Rhodanese- sulfurtransferase, partial [Gonapodya sp. JEL0774]
MHSPRAAPVLLSLFDPFYCSSAPRPRESLQVIRPIPISLDLGNLLADDPNPLDSLPQLSSLSSNSQSSANSLLQSNTRDCVQFIVNHIFALPISTVENHTVVTLPAPTSTLPREKHIPKPKPMTRWEKFAQTKGITKAKKTAKTFDSISGEYRPAYGYKSRSHQLDHDWLKEVPANADPMEDMFQTERDAKKERVEKNLKRKRRNEEAAQGIVRTRSVGIGTPLAEKAVGTKAKLERKAQLDLALASSRKSTASMGKFDK